MKKSLFSRCGEGEQGNTRHFGATLGLEDVTRRARVVNESTITTMSARCPRLAGTQARGKEKGRIRGLMQLIAWDASFLEEDTFSTAHKHVCKVTRSGKLHVACYLQARAFRLLIANGEQRRHTV